MHIVDVKGDFFTTFNLIPGPVLGTGMSGEVVLATSSKNSSVKRAVKTLSLLTPDGAARSKHLFSREIRVIQKLDHPNVIKHIVSAKCPEYLVICTDYCPGGSLHSMLPDITCSTFALYFTQLACAVRYLQGNRIVHCDIKPKNVFMKSKHQVVLGDFGLAITIPETCKEIPGKVLGGTRPFMAAELKMRPLVDPFKLDVFSLGMVTLSMAFKQELKHENVLDLMKKLDINSEVSFTFRQYIKVLTHPNPDQRPDVRAILEILRGNKHLVGLIDTL